MRAALPLVSLALLALALLPASCREKRRPISRGDGGPAVVVVDRRAPDLALLEAEPEREPNDATKEAQPLAPDHRVRGLIPLRTDPRGAPDVDCYVLGPGGPPVDLGARDAGAPPFVAFVTLQAAAEPVAIQVLDGAGKLAQSRVAPRHGRALLSYLRVDGAVVVRVRNPLGQKERPTVDAEYTLEYALRPSAPGEELEPNDDVSHAMLAPESGAITGRFDGEADRDTFALPPRTDGATYRVELGAIPDLAPELHLRDGDKLLATARQARSGELRLRNLPSTGKVTLGLRALEGAGEQPYTLRISTEPALDAAVERELNDDKARATMVKAGDSIAGYLWPGDVDWFCASADGLGAQIDGAPEVDWKLELFDAAGKSLKKADDSKRGGGEKIDPDPRGRCVRLSARARDTVFDLPYRLGLLGAP